MDLKQSIMIIILITFIVVIALVIIEPMPPSRPLEFRLTIDTHDIDIYYLTIESKYGTESHTMLNKVYSEVLPLGEYHIEVCYWNVNNTKTCEGQRVWLDEDTIVEFFVGVEDEL